MAKRASQREKNIVDKFYIYLFIHCVCNTASRHFLIFETAQCGRGSNASNKSSNHPPDHNKHRKPNQVRTFTHELTAVATDYCRRRCRVDEEEINA
jgi:hypothetical protein